MKFGLMIALWVSFCCGGWGANTYLISFHKPAALLIADESGSVLWKAEEAIDHPQDCAVLGSGDILCSEKTGVVALGLDQSVKWRYKNPQGTENPVACPIGPDRFLVAVEGPTRLLEINSAGDVLKKIQLRTTASDQVHGQIRGARKTAEGTYLVSFYREGAYREYNASGDVVRDFGKIPGAIGAIRLPNGNTMICNGESVQELDSSSRIVWEFNTARDAGFTKARPGGISKLKNGNVIIKFYVSGTKVPALLEVSDDKKIVRRISVPGYAKAGHFQVLDEDFKPSLDVISR